MQKEAPKLRCELSRRWGSSVPEGGELEVTSMCPEVWDRKYTPLSSLHPLSCSRPSKGSRHKEKPVPWLYFRFRSQGIRRCLASSWCLDPCKSALTRGSYSFSWMCFWNQRPMERYGNLHRHQWNSTPVLPFPTHQIGNTSKAWESPLSSRMWGKGHTYSLLAGV